MADLLNTIGDAFPEGKDFLEKAVKKAAEVAGSTANKLLDAVAGEIEKKGDEKPAEGATQVNGTTENKLLDFMHKTAGKLRDVVEDGIEKTGEVFQKGKGILEKLVGIPRKAADALLDAAATEIIKKAEEKLDELNRNTKKNLVVSAALNLSMLLCAALTAILMPELKSWGLLIAALVNYVILARAVFSVIRFIRTVLLPHKDLIALLLPVFWESLRELRSFEIAIKTTIRAAVRHYIEKAPPIAKMIHGVGSILGVFPNLSEIENKAAQDFYPLVCRYLRAVLLYNVLLFTICYGVLVFILKCFVLTGIFKYGIFDLYIYPFRYIYSLITGGA